MFKFVDLDSEEKAVFGKIAYILVTERIACLINELQQCEYYRAHFCAYHITPVVLIISCGVKTSTLKSY